MLIPALALLAPAIAQTQPQAKSDLTADKLVHEGNLLRGVAHARATIAGVTVAADEATFHTDTGELELRGHAHALLPARSDHTLFRYGTGSLVTDQPVAVTADRITIKNELLQASGNVAVVPADPEMRGARLHGDELYMYLHIADGTLKGNVRTVKIPDNTTDRFAKRPIFPPDIVK